MNRLLAGLLAALLVAGAVPAAATLGSTATATDTADARAPGATFAGVIGVQGAEVDNEVGLRALDRRLEAADSNASKAAVVANQTAGIEERIAELKQRREAVEAAYENGSITKAQRDARLAALAAQIRGLERRANRTAAVAADLPAEALRQHGVNVSEVRRLAHRASELGGGAVAEAAREVAGEGVGNGLGGPPEHARDRGNPSERGEGADRGKGDGRSGTATGQAGNETGQAGNETGQAGDASGEGASDGHGDGQSNATGNGKNDTSGSASGADAGDGTTTATPTRADTEG